MKSINQVSAVLPKLLSNSKIGSFLDLFRIYSVVFGIIFVILSFFTSLPVQSIPHSLEIPTSGIFTIKNLSKKNCALNVHLAWLDKSQVVILIVVTRVPGPCRHKCTHRHFHITYRPSDNTQTDIHTLPSRLPSQLFEHSCQNSETSNTTIVREPVKKSAKTPKHTNSCWSDTYGRLKCSKPALRRLDPCSSCHIFFSSPIRIIPPFSV